MTRADSFSGYTFDLDGTLVELPVRWGAASRELEALFGVTEPVLPKFDVLARLVFEHQDRKSEAFSIVDRFELESLSTTSEVIGAVELVKALSKDAKLGLVTMQGRKMTEAVLQKFGIGDYFSVTMTREDSMSRGEQIQRVLTKVGVPPSEALHVGDLPGDVNGARKAGVECAIIGTHAPEGLEPGLLFSDCMALQGYLFA